MPANYPKPDHTTDVDAAIAAGAALGQPQLPPASDGSTPYTVVPDNYKIESLEEFLPRPLRIDQDVRFHEEVGFTAYVNTFCQDDSRLFFNVEGEEFTAIFDYHSSAGVPAWCDHTAVFKPRRTPEFTTWLNQNRKPMTQVDFARFIEENLPDVVTPPSADMLAMILAFEAKKSVEFASGVRLANGQIQLQYSEVVRGTTQNGTLEVPEAFALGIPVHVAGPAYRIDARLRWRLQEGKVSFWYELVRPTRIIEAALAEIRQRIAQETGMPVLAGVAGE